MEDKVHEREAVGDESGFSRGASGMTEAAVVDCQDVRVGLRGKAPISISPPSLS